MGLACSTGIYRNKGRQMPPHWLLVPLSLKPLGITNREIGDNTKRAMRESGGAGDKLGLPH